MIALLLLALFFATLVGVAGGLLGLSLRNLTRSRSNPKVFFSVAGILGFVVGCYAGFGGISVIAASGITWWGTTVESMMPIGLGCCLLAALAFAVSYGNRH